MSEEARNRIGPDVWAAAEHEAASLHHGYLGVEHVFLALAGRAGSNTNALLRALGLDPARVIAELRREAGTGKGPSSEFIATPRLLSVLGCVEAADELGEAALLAAVLAEGESLPVRYLAALGHPVETLRALLEGEPAGAAEATRLAGDPSSPAPPGAQPSRGAPAPVPATAPPGPTIAPQRTVPTTMPTPTLDGFGRDLTKLARLGKLAEAIGRDEEIEQMITVLARTQKANPILLGEAGVGKTAIAEGLAVRIVNEQVPPVLRGKRIVELSMGSLTAGTQYRGQFEQRVSQIVKEATNAVEVILFIDEIHTVVGAGDSRGGAGDASQMLKPPLARGDFSCIGATTQDEYARFIRKDPALERRFSPVTIKELTPDATRAVLEQVAARIVSRQAAEGYVLDVGADALAAAVALTNRHVKDRHQPDKAIDALDIACAKAVVKGRREVTAELIADVVAEWTGIPAARLTADEQQRFARMEEELSARVIGQAAAVEVLSRSIRAALAGLKAPNRPIGVFLFLGPSGVGKTKLAKELAAFLFDTQDALLRFDMNEYQEKQTVSNLIGSARGYQDSERGGALTEAIRRHPYSVVLLDEIEKAHPDIFNLFLSVFDDGRITDSFGRVVDCSNAVFILTSNLGLSRDEPRVGFIRGEDDARAIASGFLRPELVNRITEVVRFRPLGRPELARILDQILAAKAEGFRSAQGIDMRLTPAVKDALLDRGCDPDMGARPLEREVEARIVQPLVDAVFRREVGRGVVSVDLADGRIVFRAAEGDER